MAKPILSKRIVVQDVPVKGQAYAWVCQPIDVEYLNANRMPTDIHLKSCSIDMVLKPLPASDRIYRLTGDITATIIVTCGISGDLFDMDINEYMEVDYAHGMHGKYGDENTDETYLLPEPIECGTIDIYESCIQELLLALPTHTVKQGVSFEYKPHPQKDVIYENEKHTPFDALQTLKEKMKK